MSSPEDTPADRAQTKLEQIERELMKCVDFRLHLIAKSSKDRARMDRVLTEIPNFELWRRLTNSPECIQR